MHVALKTIAGFATGAALMYLLDPVSGRRRRALARDQGTAAARKASRYVEGRSRKVADHAKGSIAHVRARMRHDVPDDDTVQARVRAALGHVASHAHAIEAEVHEGRVVLRGQAPAAELQGIVTRLGMVPGVHEVDNRLAATP